MTERGISDELSPGEPESATVLSLSDTCPLDGGELKQKSSWTTKGQMTCKTCGATIGLAVPVEPEDPFKGLGGVDL